ncbi:38K protein [Rice stripe necrosis virus]|uniref:38K protein n=1 Tax=Rice stripe necrosis virus TaxID=373373 RepID=B5ST99_9VIRU|nr:38K protein [Rice stripe necrosis virus]ACH87090.1 38K protein [Rice stripe necrosis virus]QJE38063.1 38K protein [Rice stripe necrosis virus]QNU12836.1 triple-gene-block protein 1 [Rice stripe necrosis virus]QNU12842.1 triple-gene-block protein 1 [Rice stripe necrosis virus]
MTSEWAREHPTDVFAIFETCAREAGFTWNDVPPHVVNFDSLEKSKAISNLTDLLENEVAKGCKEKGDVAAIKLENVNGMTKEYNARVGVCVGAPGAGKTTLIKAVMSKASRVVIAVPNSTLLKNVYSGNPNAFLIDDLFSRPVEFAKYETILIDEFTKVHVCEVLMLSALLRVKNILMFGDPQQGMHYRPGSFVYYNFPVLAESHASHRMPQAIGEAYNNAMGTKIEPKSSQSGEFEIKDLLGMIRDKSKVLCLSEKTQSNLDDCGISAELVSKVQGCEFAAVTLILEEPQDIAPFCNKSIRCVALSRAKEVLIIQATPYFKSMLCNAEFVDPYEVDSSCSGQTLCNSR